MLDPEEAPGGSEDWSFTPGTPATAAAPPWDTELFLVRAPDRVRLLDRVRRLASFLESAPTIEPKDLAFSLNTERGAGGSCLAVVAGTLDQLRARLAIAADRLADPKRVQIKDGAGIYYADRPLAAEGSLALLFPGEGGEYVNMLADLCPHFPEVAEAFEKAERLAWKASRAAGERFSRLFRLPAHASAEERAAAEKALVELDAIASGVLLADWAMLALLQRLGIRPAVVAGHSLGEIAALQACGAIEGSEEQLSLVGSVLNQLVSWEQAQAITPSKLIAVGAGRDAVEAVLRETVGEGVHLAMDNCPHQTIAVGPRDLMEVVEEELKARRFISERLPFDVPYHTPMFEPYLGPFVALFDKIPFLPPTCPIYSFSTASLFPAEPDAMRHHAVWNFARPVEFTALIRRMHADGVRLFVECGPRGNLSAFTEDILRSERFAAVASNLPTRSGPTQLNHLAGQLSAQGVALDLSHLYVRRSPRRVDWEDAHTPPRSEVLGAAEAPSASRSPTDHEASHLRHAEGRPEAASRNTHERGASVETPANPSRQLPTSASDEAHLGNGRDVQAPRDDAGGSFVPSSHHHERMDSRQASGAPSPPVSTVLDRPTRGAVMARHLSLMEQFLDDQADVMAAYLARRRNVAGPAAPFRASLPLPAYEETGLPVLAASSPEPEAELSLAALPLLATARITAFAPGASITIRRPLDLAEDLFVSHHTVGGHAVSRVDPNQHGLPVMPMTFSLEIMAELATCLRPGWKAVAIENVRLFHWLAFDEDELATVEATAEVRADPSAGPDSPFEVAITIHVVGGAANKTGARSPAGQGVVRLAPDYPAPPSVGDFPLTNEHPCRIPVEVLYRNLFHGPLFQGARSSGRSGDEGLEGETEVLARDRLFRSQPDPRFVMDPVTLDVGMHPISAWHLEFDDQSGRVLLPVELKRIELFGPQLAPGSRITSRCFAKGGSYRHFNHSVDLIGPDGRYWSRMSDLTFWRFYVPFAEVNFFGPKDEYFISKPWDAVLANASVPASCIRLDTPPDQKQKTMRIVTSKVTLAPSEMARYRALGGEDEAEIAFLFSHITAKDSVRSLWHAKHGERLYPTDIVVASDNLRDFVAEPRGTARDAFPNVAVAHLGDVVASIAAFDVPVGIALAAFAPQDDADWDETERALLVRLGGRDEWTARFVGAKQAASQALRRADLRVRAADAETGVVLLSAGLESEGIFAHTSRDGEIVVAVCLNERAAA
jgi:malonyl CoA-acyl carrier protein transacylase